tara:strand:- start:53 stop:232 length:180 start_codon:yes stop_codon:yes gene_type:complete
MENNKLFTNWETPQLFDHLYFLENEVYTTRNQYMIHEIKSILKSRKSFNDKLELYKDFF